MLPLCPKPSSKTDAQVSIDKFTLFSRFPYEIRELIWKQALRPHHSTGPKPIHKIKYTERNDNITIRGPIIFSGRQPYFRYRAELFNDRQINKIIRSHSAYLYDAGMWTACKESRRIIADENGVLLKQSGPFITEAYYNLPQYPLADNRPPRLNESLLFAQPRSKVALMTARANSVETTFQFHVYPRRDLFIIDTSDWRMTRLYTHMLYHYPFSPMLGLFSIPPLLAFEYSNAWITDIPHNLHLVITEASPRGLLVRLLQDCVRREIKCQVWLVDRVARVTNDRLLENAEAKFFDCAGEFVQANLGRLRKDDPSCYSNVGKFIRYLYQSLPRALHGSDQCFLGVLIYKEKK